MPTSVKFFLAVLTLSITHACHAQEIAIPESATARQSHVPETVKYAVMLHQVAAFKDLADAADSQGKYGSPYRHHLSKKFDLSPQQLIYFDSVALQYREEEKEVNEEIRQSIVRFRDMNGKLPRAPRYCHLQVKQATLLPNVTRLSPAPATVSTFSSGTQSLAGSMAWFRTA